MINEKVANANHGKRKRRQIWMADVGGWKNAWRKVKKLKMFM